MKKPVKNSKEPLTPHVPPGLAYVASLVVPGLGQMLARRIQRGLLLLGAMVSIVLMAGWRVSVLAHREPTAMAMLRKAFDRRPVFVAVIFLCIIILWLWIALDAYRQAAGGRRRGFGVFVLVLFTFFTLGWQISQIDPYRMIRELPAALPPFSKVIWPWQAAVTREPVLLKASTEILVPCEAIPPPPPAETPGEPYLEAEPRCGDLSKMDESNKIVAGTTLALTARGFQPNTETQIWWADPLGNEFQVRQEGKYVTLMTDEKGSFHFDLVMPYRLIPPSAAQRQTHRVEARQVASMGELKASEPLLLTIDRMMETIFMGMMATFFGIILSVPVSFLAARNIMSGSKITMAIYYLTRTILNIIRSIEPLIWALIAVVWVGLGPFAGIIALTVHSVAALGKLYSEAIESIDPGPIEAVQATGANRIQTIMFAVVPQMIAPFVSFSIYRWDINVRMSTVIGLVGGGGIGFILVQYIRLLDYRAAGIAVWFIAFTVAVLDYVSSEIRQRFV
ncbi:MAG TPA: phosphonate ABC transporter, permease protein PhnE [Spirochaetia bacterium]|nr:phosphonate ABC transporter, permease protein PhnE [Spirochaetia bacterium]